MRAGTFATGTAYLIPRTSTSYSVLPTVVGSSTHLSPPMDQTLITTAFELPGYRIARNLGVVRGVTVRSRSFVGTFGAGLQKLVGGNITLLTELCEQSRAEAFGIMIRHADDIGATGIIAVRYDATEVMSATTEVLCYGTAVIVEKA